MLSNIVRGNATHTKVSLDHEVSRHFFLRTEWTYWRTFRYSETQKAKKCLARCQRLQEMTDRSGPELGVFGGTPDVKLGRTRIVIKQVRGFMV